MKKIIGLMSVIALSLNAIADTCTIDGYTWSYTVSNGKATITGVSPEQGGDLIIPRAVNGYTVTSIGDSAFSGCSGFTGTLTIPDSVTEIGSSAFSGCSGFTGALTIPDSVTSIGYSAFLYCRGFTGGMTIPDGVTNVRPRAFVSCSGLTSVTIPKSVTSIALDAFGRCSGLVSFFVDKNNLTYKSVNGLLLSKDGENLLFGVNGNVAIPDGVTSIGKSAFDGCRGLRNITIPNSVTNIGDFAFRGCYNLTRIAIPSNVTSIGSYALSTSSREIFFAGAPPSGVGDLGLEGAKCVYFLREYSRYWRQYVPSNGRCLDAFAVIPQVEVLSTKVREEDSTILDVEYIVRSSKPTAKVRVLAFKDGVRSFANVVKPETFVDGTAVNVGDAVTANEVHKLSWQVSADLGLDLAKLSFEVLAHEGDPLYMEWITIPASDTYGKMRVSYNALDSNEVFDALMWLYADGDSGLTLSNGTLMNGSLTVASGSSANATGGPRYLFSKMGCSLVAGNVLTYVNAETRKNLSPSGIRQYAYKIVEE